LVFRFKVLNIPIASMKKFEEGVFSDLRNLKVGLGCQLEEPRSPFLVQLHELGCIRTQKKQKVFFWECVNHEYLFQEALGREKKRHVTVAQDGLTMLDADWRSMSTIWESTAPLKVTVHYLSMPSVSMDGAWGSGMVDPTVLQSPMITSSPLKAAPLARVAARALLNHSRSRASSSASSSFTTTYAPVTRPVTPASRSLPLSMYHLLNQANGMPTPDALFMNPFDTPNAAKQNLLWNDEAIAAVTYEVLKSSPELFSASSCNETDPIVEYSNWLASVTNSPSDNELSGEQTSSAYSALSLIDDAGLSMQQLDAVCSNDELANLLDSSISNETLLSSLQQEIDLAATELLFASMPQPEPRKRERSNTASSACSSRSSKRYQPYRMPGSLVM